MVRGMDLLARFPNRTNATGASSFAALTMLVAAYLIADAIREASHEALGRVRTSKQAVS